MQTIAEYLPQHPFFSGLDESVARLVAGCAVNVHFRPGQHLFHEGEPADTFYLVRHGRVSLEVRGPAGPPVVVDRLTVPGAGEPVVLRRSATSFFQGNRFLLEPMAQHVVSLVPDGPVVDLYAGVGLFGLALAARAAGMVTLVEGDHASGADLLVNARPYLERARVMRVSVETYLAAAAESPGPPSPATIIVDPPRTGLSKEALAGLLRHRPTRIVYVSCDVATLARDTRGLLDGGYSIGSLTGFDLFPNTAHVETVVEFTRAG